MPALGWFQLIDFSLHLNIWQFLIEYQTLAFTLLGAEHSYIPINILEFCFGIQLIYLENVYPFVFSFKICLVGTWIPLVNEGAVAGVRCSKVIKRKRCSSTIIIWWSK